MIICGVFSRHILTTHSLMSFHVIMIFFQKKNQSGVAMSTQQCSNRDTITFFIFKFLIQCSKHQSCASMASFKIHVMCLSVFNWKYFLFAINS